MVNQGAEVFREHVLPYKEKGKRQKILQKQADK